MYTEQELKEILQRSEYRTSSAKKAVQFLSGFSPQRSTTALYEIVKGVIGNAEHQKRVTQ